MSGLKSHNEFDSLETFFNTRLKDASLEPTDNSWMLIEEELNKLAKEKRRRRFLWFFSSGVVLICGIASLWYWAGISGQVTSNNKQLAVNSKSEVVNQKSEVNAVNSKQLAVSSEQPVGSKQLTANDKQSVEIESKKTEISSTQKIQLGAFKHKANMAAFDKIPYKIIEVNSNDGYTKYYAESNEKGALEKVQQAGFAGAFIKENFDESLEKSVVKNEGVVKSAEPVYASNSLPKEERVKSPNAQVFVSVSPSVKKEPGAVASESKPDKNEQSTSPKENNPATVVATAETTNETPAKENPAAVNETKAENATLIAVTNTGQPNPKPETSKQETAVTIETKKDSTLVKEEKKDSAQAPVKTATADSNKTNPFKPAWSLSLLAGPNFFNTNSQSSTVKTLNEHQLQTSNGEIKIQFQPSRLLSVSTGVNYSTFTAQQDDTYFRFYKYQTADYQFHSSFGTMDVPMSTMLEGFYFNAPVDSFFSHYSYTTTLQTINIPLQANVHFLNSKWVNLYLGIGANSSYAIGQHTHFSLIKENSTVEFNYNNVTANKFNLLLMASLGCDIRLTKHWYVTINPSYRYGITNFSSVSGTTYKPAFFSANGGIKFKF